MRRALIGGLAVVTALVSAACGVSHGRAAEMTARRAAVAHVAPGPQTFVSLVPACGCTRHTELEAFSTASGRSEATLGAVRSALADAVDVPAAQSDGRLLITITGGWRCAARGDYAECPRITPDSCTNRVLQDTPGSGRLGVAFSVSGRVQIGDAVPDPDGGEVALAQTPCTRVNGMTGVYLRDTRTGSQRLLFGRDDACDGYGRPSWSSDGRALVVVYSPAPSRPFAGSVGGVRGCPGAPSDIVVVGVSPGGRAVRIAPDRGCGFAAAAFDPTGVVAVEGCRRPDPTGCGDCDLGDGYLLSLARDGRRLRRWRLRRGVEEALISPIPHTDRLLVTEDLPANNDEPEADWVWELAGGQLRTIDHYAAQDAAQVLAVGW